jgi:hypothetical protein
MDQNSSSDIVAFLKVAQKWVGDELDMTQLKAGDRLLVRTRNTNYLFLMTGPETAKLTVDRPDRPGGLVRIQGCIFGRSKMIKPGHLFCGGGLEFTTEEDRQTYMTSAITELQWISTSGSAAPMA